MRTNTGWRARTLGSLIGLWLLLVLPVVATAELVSLTWDPSPEPDLAGYKLYMGTSPGSYSQIFDVGHVTNYKARNLVPGNTYYFVLTAYDIYANESSFSTEVSITISGAPSSAPGGTTSSSSSRDGGTTQSADTDSSSRDGGTTQPADTDSSSRDGGTTQPNDPGSYFQWFWNLLFG